MTLTNEKLEELEELFDLSPEPSEDELPPLNEGLTKEEQEEAEFYAQLKVGVMVITGEPGSGKDTFMHFLLWKLKTLFKGFKVMLDRKPRMLFGQYVPFNNEVLLDELQKSSEKSLMGKSETKLDFAKYSTPYRRKKINRLIDSWRDDNDTLFYNTGVGLGELWRYFYNRYPHNVMNYTMQPLLKRHRHYNLLVVGTTPHANELDIKSYLSYVTHVVECNQTNIDGVHAATIHRGRSYTGKKIVTVAAEPVILLIDGFKPRGRLGGDCVYHLFNSFERNEYSPRVRIKA